MTRNPRQQSDALPRVPRCFTRLKTLTTQFKRLLRGDGGLQYQVRGRIRL
jgi:hypothetical protein